MNKATFLFHNSLNYFLSFSLKGKEVLYLFDDKPAIKHAIEAIGIPHTEVSVILVNNKPVGYLYSLQPGDKVNVYDVESSRALPAEWHLTPIPPTPVRFVLDVHLGKLARRLRMLGFDTLYENNYSDKVLVELSLNENRVLLTRDVVLLKNKSINYAYFVRSQNADEQLAEVLNRYSLKDVIKPFAQCIACNGNIITVSKEAVFDKLLPKTKLYYNQFYQCNICKRIYWKGSHFSRMNDFVEIIKNNSSN